jgi:hypothetical protein
MNTSEDGQIEHSESRQHASEFINCIQASSSGGYIDTTVIPFFEVWANVVSDYLSGIWEINLANTLLWYPVQCPMARVEE